MSDVFIVYDCGDIRGVSHNLGDAIECLFQALELHKTQEDDAGIQWSKHDQMVRAIFKQDASMYTITAYSPGPNSIQRSLLEDGIEFDREHSPTCAVQQAVMDVAAGENYDEIAEYLERTIDDMIPSQEETIEVARDFLELSRNIGKFLGTEFSCALLGTEENPDNDAVNSILDNMSKNALEAFHAKCEPFLTQNLDFR